MSLYLRTPSGHIYAGPDREEVEAAMTSDHVEGDYSTFEVLDWYTNVTLAEVYGHATLARRIVPAAEC